jgi:two-component system, sensor histidine kinase and response regulator
MEYFLHRLHQAQVLEGTRQKVSQFLERVWNIGYSTTLEDYEKRKLGIFNQLNFFQIITGILVPIIAFLTSKKFPFQDWYVAILPACISIVVLLLNSLNKYHAALLCYFIFYPVFTCFIYISGLNLGIELSFVLYGILAVFFLQELGYMLFVISFSMVSYFMLSVTWKDYKYQLETYNYTCYLINHALSIIYIFYGLYLIKQESTGYQFKMLHKNRELHKKNLEIEEQKKEIVHKAQLLEEQTVALDEHNKVKDKLFSIISHDLKSPMYALQSIFSNAQKLDLPAEEIKSMLPDVVNDLNYTTALMENLLQWAKWQMQSNSIHPQAIDVNKMVNETVQLVHLQAEAKKIKIKTSADLPVSAWADKNMISLVLRNLLSNAVKFTPERGRIVIGINESPSCVEVFVQDSGLGISKEAISKIYSDNFYTTNGTNDERGTGLGLMLSKEFLEKNDGHLIIESEPGTGSTFSFTLPLAK